MGAFALHFSLVLTSPQCTPFHLTHVTCQALFCNYCFTLTWDKPLHPVEINFANTILFVFGCEIWGLLIFPTGYIPVGIEKSALPCAPSSLAANKGIHFIGVSNKEHYKKGHFLSLESSLILCLLTDCILFCSGQFTSQQLRADRTLGTIKSPQSIY